MSTMWRARVSDGSKLAQHLHASINQMRGAETLKLPDQEIVFSVASAKHCKAGLGSEDQVY